MARWHSDRSFGVDDRERFRRLEGMHDDMNINLQDAMYRQKHPSDYFNEPRRLVSDYDRHFSRLDRDSPSPKRFGQTTRTNISYEDPGVGRFSREFSPVSQPQFYTIGRAPKGTSQTVERNSSQSFSPSMSSGTYTTRPSNNIVQHSPQSTVPSDGYLPDRSCFVTDESGARRYKVEFEVGEGFEAENVRVIANGNKITVKVNKLEKDNFSTLSREFTRTVDVPDNVNPKEVKAFYQNGMLILEAPVNPPRIERVIQSPDRFKQPIITSKTVTRSSVTGQNYPVNQPRGEVVGGGSSALKYGYNEPRSTNTSQSQQSFYQSSGRQPDRGPTSGQQPERVSTNEDRGSFAQSLNRRPSGQTSSSQMKKSSAQISLSQPREKSPPVTSSTTGSVKSYITQYQKQPSPSNRAGFKKGKSPPIGQKFVMEVTIGKDVNPADINIHTQDGVVHLSAEWQEERAVGQPVSHRQFQKDLPLPEGVDPEAVTAHFLDEGKLVLEAPYLPYGLSDV